MEKYNTILFDLFFTLVKPEYSKTKNEFDILNISEKVWEEHAEHNDLYLKRIKG